MTDQDGRPDRPTVPQPPPAPDQVDEPHYFQVEDESKVYDIGTTCSICGNDASDPLHQV